MFSLLLIVLFGVAAIALLLAPRPSVQLSRVARSKSTSLAQPRAASEQPKPQIG